MTVNTNHIIRMGYSHKICEDYAISSDADLFDTGVAYIALGDGCSLCLDSNGKPITAHTDWGSRILVRSAYEILKKPRSTDLMHSLILQQAKNWAAALSFPRHTLSSTLLISQYLDKRIHVYVCGDGVFAVRRKGTLTWGIYEISYENGAPYYLRYELRNEDRESYLKDWKGASLKITELDLESEKSAELKNIPLDGPDRGINSKPYFYGESFSIDQYDMVVMFSDGIGTFTKKDSTTGNPTSIPIEKSIRPFLAIKNTKGEFVYRRAKAALEEYTKLGINHFDDFSMAALYISE